MWRGHELFASSLPILVEYIPVTLFYFLTPTFISLIFGALLCKVRTGKKNLLYYLVSLFISFFRGTPGLVQIYIVFFGPPKIFAGFGIDINRWDAGIFYGSRGKDRGKTGDSFPLLSVCDGMGKAGTHAGRNRKSLRSHHGRRPRICKSFSMPEI